MALAYHCPIMGSGVRRSTGNSDLPGSSDLKLTIALDYTPTDSSAAVGPARRSAILRGGSTFTSSASAHSHQPNPKRSARRALSRSRLTPTLSR